MVFNNTKLFGDIDIFISPTFGVHFVEGNDKSTVFLGRRGIIKFYSLEHSIRSLRINFDFGFAPDASLNNFIFFMFACITFLGQHEF